MKNLFISHHHKDDASVDGLVRLLGSKNYKVRNSSIRVRPENQGRIDQGKVSDNVIRRLLRMKMRWASKLVVVVGKETHQRKWVDWEIEAAHKLGKPIVGVFEDGLKGKVLIPENLEKYATSVVGWRSETIIKAIDGASQFQNPDGTPAEVIHGGNVQC